MSEVSWIGFWRGGDINHLIALVTFLIAVTKYLTKMTPGKVHFLQCGGKPQGWLVTSMYAEEAGVSAVKPCSLIQLFGLFFMKSGHPAYVKGKSCLKVLWHLPIHTHLEVCLLGGSRSSQVGKISHTYCLLEDKNTSLQFLFVSSSPDAMVC